MKLVITTPKRKVSFENIAEVYVPSKKGVMGVLKDHISSASALEIGIGHTEKEGGTKEYFAVFGGVVHISKNVVTIVTEDATLPEEISEEEIERAEKEAKEGRSRKSSLTPEMLKAEKEIQYRMLKKDLKNIGRSS